MPLLFSYGTLQQDDVQLSTFGRRLTGRPDELPRYEPSRVGPHANVTFNGNDDSRVSGTVLEVTDEELARGDAFEAQFSYERVLATLASGTQAWVYIHTERRRPGG